MNKKILNSVWLGLKKGYQLDTLPSNVRLFLELPLVRILRVIGGLSAMSFLLHKNGVIAYNLPLNLNVVVFILAGVQFTQITLISIIKIVYGIYNLLYHKEKFEVRSKKFPSK
jgi:hypothetical protein